MRPRSSRRSRPSTMLLKSTSCWVWFCMAARRCSARKASTSLRDARCACANLPRHQRCKPARATSETAIRTGKDMKGAKPEVQTRLCWTAYSRGLDESVADAAHRIEVFGGGAKLFAQAAHVRIDGAGINEAVVVPHIAKQLVPGLHAPAALRQKRQQLELSGGQLKRLPAPLDQVPRSVDKQVAQLEGGGLCRRGLTALQNLLHAQDQLSRAKGLGDVVLRAQFQADDAVKLSRFGREHNDGNGGGGGVATQHLAHLQPVDLGQHQVEHDQVWGGGAGLLDRLRAIGSGDDIKPRLLEVELQQFHRLRFIIHNEDLRSHTPLGYHAKPATTMATM